MLGLLLVAALAGCGGKSATAPATTTTGGTTTGGTHLLTATIGVQEYAFSPGADTVKVGTMVTWTNNGTVPHTVTSDAAAWDSGQLAPPSSSGIDAYGNPTSMGAGANYQRAFVTAGSFTYHCANHAQMTGTIVVVP